MTPGALVRLALDRPGLVMVLVLAWTLLTGALAVRVRPDADPGAMLPADAFARHFNEQTRKEFNLHGVVVLGVVNDRDRNGVFNPGTLKKILALSRFAATLRDPKRPERRVIASDMVAPDSVDLVEPAGLGKVRFSLLMPKAPATRAQAVAIRDRALADPLLRGTLVSADGRAMAISIPVSRTDIARRVGLALEAKIRELGTGSDRFYISGLPLVEDTFATDLLLQPAIMALPVLLLLFLLLYLLFRRIRLVVPPLLVATATVLSTMGLFIGAGNGLQVISVMIPVFLAPVALAGPLRLLSGLSALPGRDGDRRRDVEQVMADRLTPMLRTALTSAAGFASLVLFPVPAVRMFGLFMAFGIMLAWLLTIVIIPAAIMLTRKEAGNSGSSPVAADSLPINRCLLWTGRTAAARPWLVIGCSLGVAAVAGIGILLVRVNDNPVRWFGRNQPVRVADRILNSRFAGTWQAYLVLRGEGPPMTLDQAADWLRNELDDKLIDVPVIRQKALAEIAEAAAESENPAAMARRLEKSWTREIRRLQPNDAVGYDRWSTALDTLDRLRNQEEVFKRPDVLRYIDGLQRHLENLDTVGSSYSLVALVKMAHQALLEGDRRYFSIPDTVNAVAQALDTYRQSHRPDRIRHLVTRNYSRANIDVRLRSGNSRDMARLARDTDSYFAANPPPVRLRHDWAGPAFLHAAWQQRLTTGMLRSLLLGCITVFLAATLFFRSPAWGALALVPLACSIGITSAMIGFSGSDFNVPLAALSLLPLGLAVDGGMHFLQEARQTMQRPGDWQESVSALGRGTVRVMGRTGIAVAAMGTPLLFSPLVPFRSAALMLASTALCSGLAILWVLPALLSLLRTRLFRDIAMQETVAEDQDT